MKKIIRVLITSVALCEPAMGQSVSNLPVYGECEKASDYIEVAEKSVTIHFQGSSYTPPCLIVKAGTEVTVSASNKHPLEAAADIDGIVNPFRSTGESFTENQTRVMDVVGSFAYYCTRHADPETGQGMGGVIVVIP